MVVTNRQQVIFLEILNQDFINLKDLSSILKITDKTITKEIDRLNKFFLSFDTKIDVSHKSGIKILSIYSKSELYNILKSNQRISPEDEMLLILLFAKEAINTSIIANKIYTSRATIDNLYKDNKDTFNIIKTKEGIIYTGAYKSRILDIIKVLSFYVDVINYKSTFKNVLQNVNILIDDKHLLLDEQEYLNKDHISTYKDESIKSYYIAMVLNSYFNCNIDFSFLLQKREVNSIKLDETLTKIYTLCKNALNNIIFLKEKEFYPLVNHISSILNSSYKYNQTDTYIYLKQLNNFTKKYRLSVQIAQNIIFDIKEVLGSDLEYIEVYFIAIHIQALLEKKKKYTKRKVLLICEYGIGMSNFLITKLKNEIKLNIEYESTSLNEYIINENKYKEYDLILTTLYNFTRASNVIHISTLLEDKEVEKIKDNIITLENKNILKSIILKENVYKDMSFTNMNEVFSFIKENLKESVNSEFMDTLVKRCDSIDVVEKVAFLHGDPKKVDIRNKSLIIKNKDEILLNNKKVKYFIVNYWNEEFIKENINFIKWYYRIFMNVDMLEELINKGEL